MKTEQMLNPRMSYAEMAKAYEDANPSFEANPNRVGRFAKKIGYYRARQIKDGVAHYFYAKKQ